MAVKILVVDDETDLEILVRQKFRRQIRDQQFEFCFAHHGAEALEILRADRELGIVFTDINMPVMDGLELLAHINDFDTVIKTVVVSAYGDMQNIRAAMNRGAYDFLTKPIDFTDLELTINKTVQRVQALKQMEEEREQLLAIQHELNTATRIQQAILPCDFPPFPGIPEFDLYAEMIPAREVGGDFYDFFLLDDERLGLVIGDVSGKGVPAAIFMAATRTLLKSVALTGPSAGDCLTQVNRLLSLENTSFMFVTLFYGILNIRSGALEYSNAGHNPPYVISGSGGAETLKAARSLVLGVDENSTYATEQFQLAMGDGLFLFTDGITEAFNSGNEMYSDERLRACLQQANGSSPKEVIRLVVNDVREFAAGVAQSDDLTMLAVKFHQ